MSLWREFTCEECGRSTLVSEEDITDDTLWCAHCHAPHEDSDDEIDEG